MQAVGCCFLAAAVFLAPNETGLSFLKCTPDAPRSACALAAVRFVFAYFLLNAPVWFMMWDKWRREMKRERVHRAII